MPASNGMYVSHMDRNDAYSFFELWDFELEIEDMEDIYPLLRRENLIGGLGPVEYYMLEAFFKLCKEQDIDIRGFSFKIESWPLQKIYKALLNHPPEENKWRREVMEKFVAMLERPVKNKKGLYALR